MAVAEELECMSSKQKVVRSQSSPSASEVLIGQDTEPQFVPQCCPWMQCINVCVNGNKLYCKVLWVIIKTRKGLYKHRPFLSYRSRALKILLFNTTGERDSGALLKVLLVSRTQSSVLLQHLCDTKGRFIVGFYASTQGACVLAYPLLRASANFSNYPTKLRKPHAARKAVIGLLTTSFPESHFRFHAR